MEEWYSEHANVPPHLFRPDSIYMITASVCGRQMLMVQPERKGLLCKTILGQARRLGWQIGAWVVLSNHYHLLAVSPKKAGSLHMLIRSIHSITAKEYNRLDRSPGRRVWRNYWDSCITNEAPYLARLHYICMNPVRHGLTHDPGEYPFCSYSSLLERGSSEFVGRVLSAPIDQVAVRDDF